MPALGCLRDAAMSLRFHRALVVSLTAALKSTDAAFARAQAAGTIPLRYAYDASGPPELHHRSGRRLGDILPSGGTSSTASLVIVHDATGNITPDPSAIGNSAVR
jgi:hypothetical protein